VVAWREQDGAYRLTGASLLALFGTDARRGLGSRPAGSGSWGGTLALCRRGMAERAGPYV